MKNDDLLIYGIREYFKACPLLRRGRLLIDALGLAPVSYSLDVLPCDPIITQYADGDSLRQYQFAFTSREWLSPGDVDNIENSGFYERLEDWVEAQNDAGIVPLIKSKNKVPQRVELIASGYLQSEDGQTGRYQIQWRLIYTKEV